MAYGNNIVKVKRVDYPKKLERKSMLSGIVIRSYAKNGNEF